MSEPPEGRAAVAREGAGERWARRAITIPACLLGLAIAVPLLPVLLAGALLLDLFRDRRLPTVRLVLFALVYLGCESAGLLASLVLWLGSIGDRERRLRWFYALQSAWASSIFAAACRIFGIEVDVVGDESIGRGPLLLFSRHTSLADTILPAVYVARRHGLRLRWVLKRELLWDPCLDVVGRVLPNVFVRRGSYDSAREIAAVRSLARDLGEDEGVLVYPEGTRFTPAVRDRVAAALAVADPARAQRDAAVFREFHRIAGEDGQHPAQPLCVAAQPRWQRGVDFLHQDQPLLIGALAQRAKRLLEQRRQGEVSRFERKLVCLQRRHFKHLVDHLEQLPS